MAYSPKRRNDGSTESRGREAERRKWRENYDANYRKSLSQLRDDRGRKRELPPSSSDQKTPFKRKMDRSSSPRPKKPRKCPDKETTATDDEDIEKDSKKTVDKLRNDVKKKILDR